jgi:hypothetical protein
LQLVHLYAERGSPKYEKAACLSFRSVRRARRRVHDVSGLRRASSGLVTPSEAGEMRLLTRLSLMESEL